MRSFISTKPIIIIFITYYIWPVAPRTLIFFLKDHFVELDRTHLKAALASFRAMRSFGRQTDRKTQRRSRARIHTHTHT